MKKSLIARTITGAVAILGMVACAQQESVSTLQPGIYTPYTEQEVLEMGLDASGNAGITHSKTDSGLVTMKTTMNTSSDAPEDKASVTQMMNGQILMKVSKDLKTLELDERYTMKIMTYKNDKKGQLVGEAEVLDLATAPDIINQYAEDEVFSRSILAEKQSGYTYKIAAKKAEVAKKVDVDVDKVVAEENKDLEKADTEQKSEEKDQDLELNRFFDISLVNADSILVKVFREVNNDGNIETVLSHATYMRMVLMPEYNKMDQAFKAAEQKLAANVKTKMAKLNAAEAVNVTVDAETAPDVDSNSQEQASDETPVAPEVNPEIGTTLLEEQQLNVSKSDMGEDTASENDNIQKNQAREYVPFVDEQGFGSPDDLMQ